MLLHQSIPRRGRYDKTDEADILRTTSLRNFKCTTSSITGCDNGIEDNDQSALRVRQAHEILEQLSIGITLVPMETDMARKRLRHDLLKCLCHDQAGAQNGHNNRVNPQGRTGCLAASNLELHLFGRQGKSNFVGQEQADVAHEVPILRASEWFPTQLREFVRCERVTTGRKAAAHDRCSRDDKDFDAGPPVRATNRRTRGAET